jgi:hypothetical protein
MVHKSSLIPGISKFIDESVLSHYPPTSMKRIIMAGAASLYLKQNQSLVDTVTSNPLFSSLGVIDKDGMIDIDVVRDTLKEEITKSGFVRVSLPFIGDIDFTADDVDTLYRILVDTNTSTKAVNNVLTPVTNSYSGGVY